MVAPLFVIWSMHAWFSQNIGEHSNRKNNYKQKSQFLFAKRCRFLFNILAVTFNLAFVSVTLRCGDAAHKRDEDVSRALRSHQAFVVVSQASRVYQQVPLR